MYRERDDAILTSMDVHSTLLGAQPVLSAAANSQFSGHVLPTNPTKSSLALRRPRGRACFTKDSLLVWQVHERC